MLTGILANREGLVGAVYLLDFESLAVIVEYMIPAGMFMDYTKGVVAVDGVRRKLYLLMAQADYIIEMDLRANMNRRINVPDDLHIMSMR